MRTLLVAMLVLTAVLVVAPPAAACPEEPCDPPPMPLCPPLQDLDATRPVGWLKDWIACWT